MGYLTILWLHLLFGEKTFNYVLKPLWPILTLICHPRVSVAVYIFSLFMKILIHNYPVSVSPGFQLRYLFCLWGSWCILTLYMLCQPRVAVAVYIQFVHEGLAQYLPYISQFYGLNSVIYVLFMKVLTKTYPISVSSMVSTVLYTICLRRSWPTLTLYLSVLWPQWCYICFVHEGLDQYLPYICQSYGLNGSCICLWRSWPILTLYLSVLWSQW